MGSRGERLAGGAVGLPGSWKNRLKKLAVARDRVRLTPNSFDASGGCERLCWFAPAAVFPPASSPTSEIVDVA